MGGCQNYGPFLGPYYNTGPDTGSNLEDPKRDHNLDNPPYALCVCFQLWKLLLLMDEMLHHLKSLMS